MSIRGFVVVVVATLGTSGCDLIARGGQGQRACAYESDREATASLEGVSRIRIIARGGSLRVEGRPEPAELRAWGTACAGSEAALEDIQLVAEHAGDELVVETRFADGGWGRRRLDLTVAIPSFLPVEIDDSSGSVVISDVGGVRLEDGSGSVVVERVAGDVRITDGSGRLTVREVEGTVTVEEDGSGAIAIQGVARDVVIGRDGSGGIAVSDVGGDFRVERDGSGGIRSERIGGRVVLP